MSSTSSENDASARPPSGNPSSSVTSSRPMRAAAQRSSSSRRSASSSSGTPSGVPASPRVATSSRTARCASCASASAPAQLKLSSSGCASTAAMPPYRSSGRDSLTGQPTSSSSSLSRDQPRASTEVLIVRSTASFALATSVTKRRCPGFVQRRSRRRRVATDVQPGQVVSVHPSPDPFEQLVRVEQPDAEQVPVRVGCQALAIGDEAIGGFQEGTPGHHRAAGHGAEDR